MGLLAIFGITNDGLNLAVNLLLLFLVVFWIALVYWTYADSRRRIADPMLVGCATAASLFPFVGTIVYMIIRPPEYLEDVRERELEIATAEARLASSEQLACGYCSYEVEKAFLRCPSCLRRLKEPCTTCGKPLDPRWSICPYCEAEVGQSQPPRQRPRRRERAPAAAAAPAPQRSAPPAREAPSQRTGEAPPQRSTPPARGAPSQRTGEAPPQRSTPPARGAPSQRGQGPPQRAEEPRPTRPAAQRAEEPRPTRPAAQRPARAPDGSARPVPSPERDRSERPASPRPTTPRARP